MNQKLKKVSVLFMLLVMICSMTPQNADAVASAEPITIIDSVDELNIGMSYTFAASTAVESTVTWSVSNEKYASVDTNTGLVTAKKKGTVTVKATCKEGTATTVVKISGNKIILKQKEVKKSYKNSKGKEVITLSYQYPVLTGNYKGIKKINQYLTKEMNQWFVSQKDNIKNAKKESVYDPFYPHGDEVTYQITYNKSNLVCVLLQGYYFSGGAHGMPYRIAHTFNLKTGKIVSLTSLMSGNSKTIKNRIVKAFEKVINNAHEEYWESAMKIVTDTKLVKMNYYLTQDGICFYYSPYDLAAYARGFVEATVPFK